jgi:Domain of unknown function (DUF4189)
MKFMKINQIILLPIFVLMLSLTSNSIYCQVNPASVTKASGTIQTETMKYGALAIDRTNGFYFGWATDCETLAEAQKIAVDACNIKGGKCTVVLSYSGTGCAAYRTIAGRNVGLAFGWGLATTKEEADLIAKKEHLIRSYGMAAPNVTYGCNSPNSGTLKLIYNASSEITTLPGKKEKY